VVLVAGRHFVLPLFHRAFDIDVPVLPVAAFTPEVPTTH